MQLTYRGIKYNPSAPVIQVTETEEIGHYRGATYRVRRAVHVVARKTKEILKFRGAVVQSVN